nr:MAG TPA: hypothetical protein [Caudoviricetes sp.]
MLYNLLQDALFLPTHQLLPNLSKLKRFFLLYPQFQDH